MTFEKNPRLGTLRPMAENDLEMVLEWRNAPHVRANMFSQSIISLEAHRLWWARMKQSRADRYLIFETLEGPAGLVAFNQIDDTNGTAFWGFYTRPNAPKGLGTPLGILAQDYAFGTLGLRKLCAEVLGYNQASLGFHEKMGFGCEGVFVAQVRVEDAFADVHRFAAFAENWEHKRQALLRRLRGRD